MTDELKASPQSSLRTSGRAQRRGLPLGEVFGVGYFAKGKYSEIVRGKITRIP